jgi:hypothetical protein
MPQITLRNLYRGLTVAVVTGCLCFSLSSCFKEEDVKQVPQETGIIDVSPTSGPKNTILSISGNNFPDKSAITVKVNGKTTPIIASTANSIQAQIQPGTGTGKVEVSFNGTTFQGPTFTYKNTYTVTSLTNGAVGYVDGPLATAEFEDIEGLAIDANDNLYPSDWSGSNNLRKINLNTSTVSTLAVLDGGGEFLSTDAAGNIYFADEDNRQISKITPAGVVSTLATPSFSIQGIKVGASGNIYVSGRTNIAKYSPAGTLLWRLTSHGSGDLDGDTSVVKFALYGSMDVDPTETKIYVINNTMTGTYPSKIKMLDLTAKKMTTIAGSSIGGYVDGSAVEAEFSLAYGVTLDKVGGLYIADYFNSAIRYLKDGIVSTAVGGNGAGDAPGVGTAAKINEPQQVAFDSKGNMYIADFGNTKIYKVVID